MLSACAGTDIFESSKDDSLQAEKKQNISIGMPSDIEASLMTLKPGETIRSGQNRTIHLMDKYNAASGETCYRVRYNRAEEKNANSDKKTLKTDIEIYCQDKHGHFESVKPIQIEPDIFTNSSYIQT